MELLICVLLIPSHNCIIHWACLSFLNSKMGIGDAASHQVWTPTRLDHFLPTDHTVKHNKEQSFVGGQRGRPRPHKHLHCFQGL